MASEILLKKYGIVWYSSTTKGSGHSSGSIKISTETSLADQEGNRAIPCVARVAWNQEDVKLDMEFGAVYDPETRRLDKVAFRGETDYIAPSIEPGPEDNAGISTLKVTAFIHDSPTIDGFPECIELWAKAIESQAARFYESELRRMGVRDESHQRLNEMLQEAIEARFR